MGEDEKPIGADLEQRTNDPAKDGVVTPSSAQPIKKRRIWLVSGFNLIGRLDEKTATTSYLKSGPDLSVDQYIKIHGIRISRLHGGIIVNGEGVSYVRLSNSNPDYIDGSVVPNNQIVGLKIGSTLSLGELPEVTLGHESSAYYLTR